MVIGISGTKVWETGWEAVRIGIASFFIPFGFALNPALMLRGTLTEIGWAVGTATVGAVLIACGARGFALRDMGPIERVIFLFAGALFIAPGLELPASGLAIAVVLLGIQYMRGRAPAPT